MKKISSPHDKYFKFNLSIKRNAVEFFTNYFPDEILKLTNFETLEISKDSFVDEELKEYFSDILYTVNIAGSDSYIYILLEHKSYNDTLTVIQTLKYIIHIWELHLEHNKIKDKYKTRKLPIILPV
ncbi:MAG: Rpn family recombination-promoting nuclease/putative transposase, partial [Desulfobacula sp.]|nr:Rpn family recombination-promoting nuclease/putative transposase [Desulfobacula sp.]